MGDKKMVTKEEIYNLFSRQLDSIKNREIREKVIDTWDIGCKRGKWHSVDELLKIPFTLLVDTAGINFIEHTIAVTEGAVMLARAQVENYKNLPYKIDFDRLYAGGLLHDVGKLLEIEPDGNGGYRKSLSGKYARHPISGALLAQECGLSEDIINTIACHSKEGDGRPQVADFATFNPLVMRSKGLLIEEK